MLFGKKEEKIQTKYDSELSSRVLKLVATHTSRGNPVQDACSLLKEILNPIPSRYDMIYRYEHSLRVTANGRLIAKEEGWNEEPLVIACLLHDIGYPECKDLADLKRHPRLSSLIAELFLDQINYDKTTSQRICRAIEVHNVTEQLPEGLTPFEISVRDADDIDRFGVMRTFLKGNSLIGENCAETVIFNCRNELIHIDHMLQYPRGTKTAKRLMSERLLERKKGVEALITQMETTKECEDYISIQSK